MYALIRLGGCGGGFLEKFSAPEVAGLCLQPAHIRSFLMNGFCLLYLGRSAFSAKVGRTRWASDACILYSSEGGGGGGELGADHFVQKTLDGGWVYVGESEVELCELDHLGEG